jgi:hypothetical protein
MQRIDRIDTMEQAALERERETLRRSRWTRWRSMLRYGLLIVSIFFGGPPAVERVRGKIAESGARASAAKVAPRTSSLSTDAIPPPFLQGSWLPSRRIVVIVEVRVASAPRPAPRQLVRP